jgi:Xaa-Pro aminopeptidase
MMSASFGRYQAPRERMFARGPVDEHVLDELDLAAQATQSVIDGLGAGLTSHAADDIARNYGEERNMKAGFRHRVGYSVVVAYPPPLVGERRNAAQAAG